MGCASAYHTVSPGKLPDMFIQKVICPRRSLYSRCQPVLLGSRICQYAALAHRAVIVLLPVQGHRASRMARGEREQSATLLSATPHPFGSAAGFQIVSVPMVLSSSRCLPSGDHWSQMS